MTHFSWRQIRGQVAVLYVAIFAFALVLAANRPHIADGATNVLDLLTRMQRNLDLAGLALLAVIAPLIGAFFGAPLVAREVENGTHRLVWNQSITRRRWLTVKVGTCAAAVSIAVGALSLGVTQWASRIDGAVGQRPGSLPGRLTPIGFAMRGVAPVGYALLAVVLGTLIGTIIRRTLPAMALTILLMTGVQVAFPTLVRPNLLPPTAMDLVIDRSTLDGVALGGSGSNITLSARTANRNDWIIINETRNGSGERTALPATFAACVPGPNGSGGPAEQGAAAKDALDRCLATLAADGYRQHIAYLPAERFWDLQWRELGIYVMVAGLLLGINLVLIRRV